MWLTSDVNLASDQVQQWMKELDGFDIPDIAPTFTGMCTTNDSIAIGEAAQRGWWTCGGYTRDSDITNCPDTYTWGVRYVSAFLAFPRSDALASASMTDHLLTVCFTCSD